MRRLQELYKDVQEKLQQAHGRNAARYNLRRRPLAFNVRDLVWKRNFTQSNAANFFSAKLTPPFVGPFTIVKKLSPNVYTLADGKGKPIGNWHVSDLKPYLSAD